MRHFFGFTKEPFSPDIKLDELYHTAALEGVKERFLYAVSLGAISVITGDVGSGKSTALRYASGGLHPSQYHVIPVIASTGSVIEVFKQICIALDINWNSTSLTRLMHTIRETVSEIAKRRQVPVLIIEEASLLHLGRRPPAYPGPVRDGLEAGPSNYPGGAVQPPRQAHVHHIEAARVEDHRQEPP